MALDRLWAGWRSDYLASVGGGEAHDPTGERCPFCRILGSDEPDELSYVVRRGETCFVVLNAYPYASGHVLVMPYRHVGDLGALTGEEASELWATVHESVDVIGAAYRPEGFNIGVNLGRAGGAGVPGHLHAHVVPRWGGDSNFMTSVAEVRVLPESLPSTWERLTAAWRRHRPEGP